MSTASTWERIDSTLRLIKTRDNAYHGLTDRFAPLFVKQEQLRVELSAAEPPYPAMDQTRLIAGVPLLVGMDLAPLAEAFRLSADSLLPILADVLQLKEKTTSELQSYLENNEHLLELAGARLEGNQKHLEDTSAQLGLSPRLMLPYIAEAFSAPVFGAVGSHLGKLLSSISWEHGYCPVCGGSPSIAQLSPNDSSDNEFLVGGGGKKYLHCSLCGHDWHFKRHACAACGNEDSDTRELLFLESVQHERIEVCNKCGKYMLSVDMRQYGTLPHLDTIQMGLIHLDILAHERQLTPISPTIWNSVNTS